MDLILGVDRQLEIERAEDVNVREDSLFAVLDDLLPLDVELEALVFEHGGDGVRRCR